MAKIFKPVSTNYRSVCKDFLVEGGEIDFSNLGIKDKLSAVKLLQGPGFGSVIQVREYLGTQQTDPNRAPVVLTAQVEAKDPDEFFTNIVITWSTPDEGLKTIIRKVPNYQPAYKSFAELPLEVFPPQLRNSVKYWQTRYSDRVRLIVHLWDDPNNPQGVSEYGGNYGPDPFKEDVIPPEICPECGAPLSKVNSRTNPDPHRYYCERCCKYYDIYHNVLDDDNDTDDEEEEEEEDK